MPGTAPAVDKLPPCSECAHGPEFHRHNDDLSGPDCHGKDGNYECFHFRCLWPWSGNDFDPRPGCRCLNYEGQLVRDDNFYPFGKLDPNDPIDQAIVKAFNRQYASAKGYHPFAKAPPSGIDPQEDPVD